MKVTALLLASLGMVSAFITPSSFPQTTTNSLSRSKTMTMAVDDILGADVETGGVWDPWGFSKDESQLYRRRVVELKHGRVCMLAVLGNFVGCLWHPLYDGKIPGGIKAITALPSVAWLQILAAIAVVELSIGKQDFENKAPGDLGFGLNFNPFPDDPEKFADLQLKELKNGRLAMVAIMGQLIQEGLTGQNVIEQLAAGHINPFGDGQGFF